MSCVLGKGKIVWELEAALALIEEGTLSETDIVIQALGAKVGLLSGAFQQHHMPWRTHYNGWASFCASLFSTGTNKGYRLMQGFPKVDDTTASQINFVCPSPSTLESHKRAVDYSSGPQPALITAFALLAKAAKGSDESLLRVRAPKSLVHCVMIAEDSTILGRGAFRHNDTLMGVLPALSKQECENIWALPGDERNLKLKSLDFVTGVTQYVACSLGSPLHSDFGREWTSDETQRKTPEAIAGTLAAMKALDVCQYCRDRDLACESFCRECHAPNAEGVYTVCAGCSALGFTEWSGLRRVELH